MEPAREHVSSSPGLPGRPPNRPEYVEVEFTGGIPVAVNGRKMGPAKLLAHLNVLGGKHGIGPRGPCREPVRGDEVPRRVRDAGRDDPARGATGPSSRSPLDAR